MLRSQQLLSLLTPYKLHLSQKMPQKAIENGKGRCAVVCSLNSRSVRAAQGRLPAAHDGSSIGWELVLWNLTEESRYMRQEYTFANEAALVGEVERNRCRKSLDLGPGAEYAA